MNENATSSRAIDGLRVIDLSRVLAEPLCASMPADLGASVTKIEVPGRRDDSRSFDLGLTAGLVHERALSALVGVSTDRTEGARAFGERSAPSFEER